MTVNKKRDAGAGAQPSARVLTLVLPMPENIANARMHWRVKHNAKIAYWDALDLLLSVDAITDPPETPLARARIASVMYVGGRMDADNAMARHKWVCDWLQRRGYIANDKHLEWATLSEQVVRRKGRYRIELTLTELP